MFTVPPMRAGPKGDARPHSNSCRGRDTPWGITKPPSHSNPLVDIRFMFLDLPGGVLCRVPRKEASLHQTVGTLAGPNWHTCAVPCPCWALSGAYFIWSHGSPSKWGLLLSPLTAEVAEARRGHTANNQQSQVWTKAVWLQSAPEPLR